MSDLHKYSAARFEEIKRFTEDGIEFWFARELQTALEYSEWRNFNRVIEKAKQLINNGLAEGLIVNCKRVIETGKGARREIIDYQLDKNSVEVINKLAYNKLKKDALGRNETIILSLVEKYCKAKNINFFFQYALGKYKFDCLLGNKILIEFDEQHHSNGRQKLKDSVKDSFARKNGYSVSRFNISHDIVDVILAIEKYEGEIRKESKFAKINSHSAYSARNVGGMSSVEFAFFHDHGFKGLYGGLSAKEIHLHKGLKKSQKILDHMGSTEMAANLFRATQTDEKLRREKIKGKTAANRTHYEVGQKVRKTIEELGGTMPEDLPKPEKSVKQIEKELQKKKALAGEE